MDEYGLNDYDAEILTATREMADYFEAVIDRAGIDPKICANWITGELSGALNKAGLEISDSPVNSLRFGGLLQRIADKTISGKIAKQVFELLWQGQDSADEIIEREGLKQLSDSGAIEKIVNQVIADNPNQLEQYRSGKEKLFGFFVGQVMKATHGRANPQEVNKLLKSNLNQ